MIVVADTGPLNYLIQIECDALLPQLYGRIVVPVSVVQELEHADAPVQVRRWLAQVPAWIDMRAAAAPPQTDLLDLDPGEREAIQLAEEQNADLLLIDERKGRRRARQRGLKTTGTLGVLLSAGELGLIDAEMVYRQLVSDTTFRISTGVEAQFLALIRR